MTFAIHERKLSDAEWRHMISVLQLDSLKGDKQSIDLLEKLSIPTPSERDKVLDIAISHFIKLNYPHCDHIPPMEIIDYLQSLRTTTEAHR